MTDNTQKPAEEAAPKSKGDKWGKWIFAGTLAAAAASAFMLVNRPPAAPPTPEDVSLQQSIASERNLHPAFTKDKQAVRVYLDLKTMERGANYADDISYGIALQSQATLAIMAEVSKYNADELAANAANIQQAVAAQLEKTIAVGTASDGTPQLAKQGVNFGAPKIDKITDARGENILYSAPILPGNMPVFRFGT